MGVSSMQNLYSKIYSQALSPDMSTLCVGNDEGKIATFNVSGLTTKEDFNVKDKLNKPEHMIQAHNDSIFSMTSTNEFCVAGTSGCLSGWRWSELADCEHSTTSTGPTAAWSIRLESDQANFGSPEINSLAYDEKDHILYAACGDWRTRSFDLETGKQIASYQGHEDYVHDVVICENQVASCGEDGNVLLWDKRNSKEPEIKLTPSTYDQLNRPRIGKYVSSVDISNDWLVCGGGPNCGLFHLRSLALTASLPQAGNAVNINRFTRQGNNIDGIVIAGDSAAVTICNISGEVTAEIKSSSSCVYTVNIGGYENNLLTIGGASPLLDVCLNLNYKDHSVFVC